MPKTVTNLNKQNTNLKSSYYIHDKPFKLVSGEYLAKLELVYATYGTLNAKKDNVILIHHSLSMSAHAADWWSNMIGEDKPLDTNKYFIICINNLGSCFGSTGPSNYPADNFPLITIHDMVISQKYLLDHLGLDKIKLVTGSSMGGMLSLAWLQLYPETLSNMFIAATCVRAYPVNIFNRMIQQEIIKSNLNNAKQTLKIARMLGYFFYRSSNELNNRFADISTQIETKSESSGYLEGVYKNSELYKYYDYNSEKFVNNFDYKSYLCLLNAMDLYDLTIQKNYHQAGFTKPNHHINITIAGITSDILFPMEQQLEINELLNQYGFKTKFIKHQSSYGHDAFLVEHNEFGGYITELLG